MTREAHLEPPTLEGRFVRLEPLGLHHVEPLCEVGLEPDLWRWTTDRITNVAEMTAYVEQALAARADGTALPFATVERASGRVVGSTRFGSMAPSHRRAEIGWTFVAPAWQRTAVNTEAKLLMLAWAFEEQRWLRVELKTDVLNERSRRAILRLGARQEGIFRKHIVCSDGRVRDTVYFSVVDDEWPRVRERLEELLSGGEPQGTVAP